MQNSSWQSGVVRMALPREKELVSKFEDPIQKNDRKDGPGDEGDENDTDLGN